MPAAFVPQRFFLAIALLATGASRAALADDAPARGPAGARPSSCDACVAWNAPQPPFRIFGNTYYVGVKGLSVVLVTSRKGHVLIDGALPESVPQVIANIEALGFDPKDIRRIVNSHAHFDHAGGIAELQAITGADVATSAWSGAVLRAGRVAADDPQVEYDARFPPVARTSVVADGETIRVGDLALTAHRTGGHTPGGMSWTWRSCEDGRCLDLVYADSLTPVSGEHFRYTDTKSYPQGLDDFERSYAILSSLSCDVLVTAHPDVGDLFGRLARREAGDRDALIDRDGCRTYVAAMRRRLDARIATERAQANADE